MSMYNLDETEKSTGIWAEDLENQIKKTKDILNKIFNPKSKRSDAEELELCLEYLEKLRDSYSSYWSLVQNILSGHSGIEATNLEKLFTYTPRSRDAQSTRDKIDSILIKPITDIMKSLKNGYTNSDYQVDVANGIIYTLRWEQPYEIEMLQEEKSFKADQIAGIREMLHRIAKELYYVETDKELNLAKARDLKRFFPSISNKFAGTVDAKVLAKINSLIPGIMAELKQETDDKIAMNDTRTYNLEEIKINNYDSVFLANYSLVDEQTKKKYGLASIDIAEYKRLLIRKERLKKLAEGLKDVRRALGEVKYNNSKNNYRVGNAIALVDEATKRINNMMVSTEEKIAEIERIKDRIAAANQEVRSKIEEFAEILFKMQIGESYDKDRYNELRKIVTGYSLERAERLATIKLINFKTKNGLGVSVEDQNRHQIEQKLNQMTNEALMGLLLRYGGLKAVAAAREEANYFTALIVASKSPRDYRGLDQGKKDEAFMNHLREAMIIKLSQILPVEAIAISSGDDQKISLGSKK